MNDYEQQALKELEQWQLEMQAPPSFFNSASKKAQMRINKLIPEKIHVAMTGAIKNLIKTVIIGTRFTTGDPKHFASLQETERQVKDCISFYRNAATAEGGVTGAGGFLLGLVDFPVWLTLKMKMLFEIARLYGYDTKDFQERIFLLYIFQLTFSSQRRRNELYPVIAHWQVEIQKFKDINSVDWRNLQQEYRDHIDLAKLFQLIPWIGAAVGAVVNHRLTTKLGNTAMNAFRLRLREKLLLK
ncbi:MAG TPA: EcsC family protein [Cyclobacteriaceae bacterium]|nr:EcsC family protein [Cyclobacteriaceae bacterium]